MTQYETIDGKVYKMPPTAPHPALWEAGTAPHPWCGKKAIAAWKAAKRAGVFRYSHDSHSARRKGACECPNCGFETLHWETEWSGGTRETPWYIAVYYDCRVCAARWVPSSYLSSWAEKNAVGPVTLLHDRETIDSNKVVATTCIKSGERWSQTRSDWWDQWKEGE